MARNDDYLADGDGNFADWIEVQNQGQMFVDLEGWYLTDDPAELNKWVFPDDPSLELNPGEFLLIFASGQSVMDYVDAGGNLHTTFRLNADGE